MARRALAATLKRLYPEMTIVGETGSVADTVEWLDNPDHKADLIFMDVELSDGNSFEIFRRTKVNAQVIMTTAYDNYAVKAFEVDSTDYLMKPVSPEDLKRAVERAMSRSSNTVSVNDGTEPGQVKDAVKTERVQMLEKLSDRLHEDFIKSHKGMKAHVLFESTVKDGMISGYTENYIRVERPAESGLEGKITEIEL